LAERVATVGGLDIQDGREVGDYRGSAAGDPTGRVGGAGHDALLPSSSTLKMVVQAEPDFSKAFPPTIRAES
jgi:hypothetical protein